MDKVTVGGLVALIAFICTTTAIVWKWPDTPGWVLGVMVLLFVIVLALWYLAAGKDNPA